jgi:hypothetical protein
MSAIRLRFVQGEGLSSDAIEWRESICMPIVPSHVECVDPETGKYIGQHMDASGGVPAGMQAREPGYDAPFHGECFVDLPCTDEQAARFYAAARASIGQPYDWEAILGFALPGHWHVKFEAICSAKMFLLLRDVADWFPSHAPVAVPAHCIDPRDLLFAISTIIKVDH